MSYCRTRETHILLSVIIHNYIYVKFCQIHPKTLKKMSSEENKTPWKNGFWFNKGRSCFLLKVDGENFEMKNIVCLDYPGKYFNNIN